MLRHVASRRHYAMLGFHWLALLPLYAIDRRHYALSDARAAMLAYQPRFLMFEVYRYIPAYFPPSPILTSYDYSLIYILLFLFITPPAAL